MSHNLLHGYWRLYMHTKLNGIISKKNHNLNVTLHEGSKFLSYQSGSGYMKFWHNTYIMYLHTASTNCCPTETPWFTGGRNSLLSYFDLIHRSFSSRLELGVGLARPRELHSNMLLARAFPTDSITLRCPGLQATPINPLTQCLCLNTLHTTCQ